MKLINYLRQKAGCFLTWLLGNSPTNEQLLRSIVKMPNIKPINHYRPPNYRKTGVAAAKRAARKRKNKGRLK